MVLGFRVMNVASNLTWVNRRKEHKNEGENKLETHSFVEDSGRYAQSSAGTTHLDEAFEHLWSLKLYSNWVVRM
jgi:hypothetical protein